MSQISHSAGNCFSLLRAPPARAGVCHTDEQAKQNKGEQGVDRGSTFPDCKHRRDARSAPSHHYRACRMHCKGSMGHRNRGHPTDWHCRLSPVAPWNRKLKSACPVALWNRRQKSSPVALWNRKLIWPCPVDANRKQATCPVAGRNRKQR